MNILLVTPNYYPFIGGVETHARQVAYELAKVHQVRVAAVNFAPCCLPSWLGVLHSNLLAPSYSSFQDGPISVHALTPSWYDRLKMLPIALRTLPFNHYTYYALRRLGYECYHSAYLPKLRQLLQGVDIVHSLAFEYLGWAVQAASQELGIPFVCTPFVHPHQWGGDEANVAYYKSSQAVIALLGSDQQHLLSLGVPASNLHVIGVSPDLPPTVDPKGFCSRHGLEGVPLVLYIGRMMPQKGAKALLAATKKVWQVLPEARFVFIGPLLPESAQWFENTDSRILYLGKVSNQEKANALAACDVFCMPSLSEILPTVYLEAWSYGKPVVGGKADGLPELIEGNQAGISVSQDPEEISDAVTKLLLNSQLSQCYGKSGQELVTRNYTVEAVVSRLEILYSHLVSVEGSQ